MPRYFFTVRYMPGPGGVAVDHEGDECADLADARAHALRIARDMVLNTRFDMIRNLIDCSFEISDADGLRVLILPFADAIPDESV